MTKTEIVLANNCGNFKMRDGARIFRNADGTWSVRSDDGLYLLARGPDAIETEWDMDRKTSFGDLPGAVEAWLRAFSVNGSTWKGI